MSSNAFTYPPVLLPYTEQPIHRYSWESQSKFARRFRGLMVSSLHKPPGSSSSNDTINWPMEDDLEFFADEEEEQNGGNEDDWDTISVSSEGSQRLGYSTASGSEAEDEEVINSIPRRSYEDDISSNLDDGSDFEEITPPRVPCNSPASSQSSPPTEQTVDEFSWNDFYKIALKPEHFANVSPRTKKNKLEEYNSVPGGEEVK